MAGQQYQNTYTGHKFVHPKKQFLHKPLFNDHRASAHIPYRHDFKAFKDRVTF